MLCCEPAFFPDFSRPISFRRKDAMKFMADNWQLVFGGVGTAVLAAIIGAWAKSYFDGKSANATGKKQELLQRIRAGNNSVNTQAERDASVSIERR
jgi:hypothetical protein